MKVDYQKKLNEAVKILNKNKLKNIWLGNFGIYYQYEMAGTKIRFGLLEDYCGNISDEDYEYLCRLLSFVTQNFIYKTLKFPEEGQNKLYLSNKGDFSHKTFSL